jgi:hypothetical protein
MYQLLPDEKTTPVMIYTQNQLVRGDVVTKQNIRVSIWLRTEGAPEYLHLLKAQVITLNSSPARALNLAEIYMPTTQVLCFHMTPPDHDPMDYDETEKNRVMQPVVVQVGTFLLNGFLRISTQVDLGTSISSNVRVSWFSLYHTKISNPNIPQMGEMPVPMLLMRPTQVSFGLANP